jgi:CheY-like chemotaxis protein
MTQWKRSPQKRHSSEQAEFAWRSETATSERSYPMPAKSKTRILVVEDDISVRLTISQLLSEQGYEVTTAGDGFDALLRLQQEVPHLILSDLNMPQMSGFELLSVVRRRFPEILVVASSGAYDSSEIPNGVIADAFYAKGQESASGLLEVIATLIRTGPKGHKGQNAPVWIPRNGKDHDGKPFVLLTCTECLRSFPFTVDHEPTGEVLKTPCIYCPHEVTYIIDFSRSVNSPEKRAAWKAAFLKPHGKSAAAGVASMLAPPDVKKSVRSQDAKTDAKLDRIEWL